MNDERKIIPFKKRGHMQPILTDAQRWALWAVDGEPDPGREVPEDDQAPVDANIIGGE